GGNFVPPDLLTAVARSSNEIDLSWTDSNAHDTGYAVERSTDPSGGFVVIAIVSQSPLSFRDASVADRPRYSYFVRALSRKGRQRVAAERAGDCDDAALPDVDDRAAHDHDEHQHHDHHDADRVRRNGRAGLSGEGLERDAVRPYRRRGVHRARPRGVSRLPRRAARRRQGARVAP